MRNYDNINILYTFISINNIYYIVFLKNVTDI